MNPGSMYEGILLALDQIRANKFRSALTILGVVVGVATVMAMSAMIGGIRTSIVSELEAMGPKNFIVVRYDFSEPTVDDGGPPPWQRNPRVTPAEAKALLELDKVAAAVVDVDGSAAIEYGKNRVSGVQIAAEGAGWTAFTAGSIIAGRDFLPPEVAASRPVVVVSSGLARELFGVLEPVGRTVRIDGQVFTVIGVFDLSGNVFTAVFDKFAFVPYTAGFKYLDLDDRFLGILVVPEEDATQEEAMDQVTVALRTMRGLRPGEENNFGIVRQDEILETFNQVTGVIFLVMISLSSIALMVGGVGVIAIMMIAVTERTREIGIRKALGATPREILWQFLVEAATLTLVGASVGMLFGGGAAALIASVTPIPASVPLGAILAALVMAVIAGICFGMWPAWRASRLDPVVALRHE
ncbi:MAG: ABC transporter permease [Longimicrobiales bacterium]